MLIQHDLPSHPKTGPAWLLSVDPPVYLAGIPIEDYLGLAGPFAERFGNIDAGFIVFPTWSLDRPRFPEAIRRAFLVHAADYPRHTLRFICNTEHETRLLLAQGLPAEFLNKNFTVSEQIFRPLDGVEVEFDAIYNARFVPDKRHQLAALVPRVAYVTYVEKNRLPDFTTIHRAIMARTPAHALLNEVVNGSPVPISRDEINKASARAAVGLVLSPVEGSSYASMEYMLAGMPVVSTPSVGGRDVYFDPDFCVICEPDPAAVRDAVADLRSRNISREEIRARTLAKIEPARRRFLTLIDEVLDELGAAPRFGGGPWPFGERSGVPWLRYVTHLDRFVAERDSAAHPAALIPTELPRDIQLQPQEIAPIVAAIEAKPGCRLLVFGCGNDSAFWEAANAGGETAFLEDNQAWAAMAQAALRAAKVYLVAYETHLSQWRDLLDSPDQLKMQLPAEIASRQWDVILVDGPAGYDPSSTPGRMKAIYAASCLVAPNGQVFVHDTERDAEAAYAARYLGDERLFVEARGHATLKGYAF